MLERWMAQPATWLAEDHVISNTTFIAHLASSRVLMVVHVHEDDAYCYLGYIKYVIVHYVTSSIIASSSCTRIKTLIAS